MGCIKTKTNIKINKRESIKDNELEQKKLISTYVSSSQCGESEASSNNLSIKNKSVNNNENENKNKNDDKNIISENSESSEKSENSEVEKDSPEEKGKG